MKKYLSMLGVFLVAFVGLQAQTKYSSAMQFMVPAKSTVPGLATNSASSRAFDFSAAEAQKLFFAKEKSLVISSFPVGMSESKTVELKEATSVFDGTTHIYKMVNGSRVEIPIPHSRCFSGKIQGESASKVFVVMTGDEMYSSIERQDGVMLQLSPALSKKNTSILQDNTHGPSNAFVCGAENLEGYHAKTDYQQQLKSLKNQSIQATDLKEATIAVETDRFLWARMGKDEARISRYLYTIFSTVCWIYEREVNCTLTLGDVIIHTDIDPDPYTENAKGDIGALLREFSENWKQNYTPIKRTIAVLYTVPGVTSVGGIAYRGTLCTKQGFAACGIQTNSVLPTQGYQWDSFVTAHEIGHNFGALHTHDCSWAPPIDSCVSSVQGSSPIGDACWTGAPKPSKGSIMSYCHLFFPPPRFTFLPQVAAVIRAGADASCMKLPTKAMIKVTQPIGGTDQIVRIDTGVSIEWAFARVSNVNVEYSLDGGKTFKVIPTAINLPATDRFFKWTPPNGTASTQAMIRIYQTDNQNIADTSFAVFTLGAPSLTLRTLSGGERIGRKTNELLVWERVFLSKNSLQFSPTGTDPWTTILSDTTLTQYTWKVPDIETMNAKLRVVGGGGNSIISESGSFAIGTPVLSITSPVLNDSACISKTMNIRWQSDFVRTVDIRYSRNNGGTFPLSQTIASGTDATKGSFAWVVPDKSTDSAVIRVTNTADPAQLLLSDRFQIKNCIINSVNETPEMNGLRIAKLFPTPASDFVVVSIENNRHASAQVEMQITASDGRTVLTRAMQLSDGTQNVKLELSDMSSGGYVLIIRAEGAELSLPFVVTR